MTVRLVGTARRYWTEFDGWAASLNIDPLELPYTRFCNLVYHWITKDGDEESISKYRTKLWIPFKRYSSAPLPSESPWSSDNENSALKAFLSEVGSR